MKANKLEFAAGCLSLLLSGASLAQDYDMAEAEKSRQRHESAGLLGGMVLGGLIAGPPGAIVTAVAGALAGNHVSDRNEKALLQASLARTETELGALESEKRRLELAMEELQRAQLVQAGYVPDGAGAAVACCADSALVLHFRSNSAVVEPHYQEQLKDFAKLARQLPDAAIQLSGHADRRGDERDNVGLSQRRILAVQQALKTLGVENATLQTAALGESRPLAAEESLEGNFFDRRVELRIRASGKDLLTRAE